LRDVALIQLRDSPVKILASIALPVLLASVAAAQQPAAGPNARTRITGTLTAISATSLKVRDANGQEVSLGVAPNVTVVATRPVAKDSVKPGDFVASANLSQSDGIGRSIEMRLFEPGSRAGEGNRPMTQPGAAPGQMMTNATVTKVAQTQAGLELDVQYPGGIRHLIVPADVTIVGSYPVDPTTLKPGMPVTATASRSADGALLATRVQITAAPPAAP
jgi:hypothetical protein